MKILLDALVTQHLVHSFTHQRLSESTQLVGWICAIDDLEEVALLKQPYCLVYALHVKRVLAQGRNILQSLKAKLMA